MIQNELSYPSKSKYMSTKERSAFVSALLANVKVPSAIVAYESIQTIEYECVERWRECDDSFKAWKKAEAVYRESEYVLKKFNVIATRYALSIEIENAQEFRDFNRGDEVGTSKRLQRLLAGKDDQLAAVCRNMLTHFESARDRLATSKETFVAMSQKLSVTLSSLEAATVSGVVALKVNGIVIPKKKVTPRAESDEGKKAAAAKANGSDAAKATGTTVPPVGAPVTNNSTNGASAPK
jgi:hypothetical protein